MITPVQFCYIWRETYRMKGRDIAALNTFLLSFSHRHTKMVIKLLLFFVHHTFVFVNLQVVIFSKIDILKE
jgi:hypothetical protein